MKTGTKLGVGLAVVLVSALTAPVFAQDLPDLEGRTLTVGSDTTYPPFETVAQDGSVVGFDVDVVNAVCERVNCVAEFQTTAWDGIFPALANGEFDMVASGVSITPERDEIVDFTDPYHIVTQAIAVRGTGLSATSARAPGPRPWRTGRAAPRRAPSSP